MAKAALVAVSLAAVAGIAFAVGHADAKPKPSKPPNEDIDLDDNDDSGVIPEPAEPPNPDSPNTLPGDQGAGTPEVPPSESGGPGAGNGNLELLPAELRNIDLSGNEEYQFIGATQLSDLSGNVHPYFSWVVKNSLNGMNIDILKSMENPQDWIASFLKVDPPGSSPAAHHILFKVSDTPNKQWLIENTLVP